MLCARQLPQRAVSRRVSNIITAALLQLLSADVASVGGGTLAQTADSSSRQ